MEEVENYCQKRELQQKKRTSKCRECEEGESTGRHLNKKIKEADHKFTYGQAHGKHTTTVVELCEQPSNKLLVYCDSEAVSDGGKKGKKVKQTNTKQIRSLFHLQNTSGVPYVDSDPGKGCKLNYDELEDRIKTFKLPPQWKGPPDYQSMAEAGFVCTGQEDLVFCFHCNIKLDRWSKDMEPLLRHKEESPTCSFMRQRLQAVKGKTKSVVASSKPLSPRLTSSSGQLQSSSLTVSKAIHTVVTGFNEPRLSYGGSFNDHPGASLPITAENYQSEAERIKSFVGWPLNEAVHPEQLARVGFVYTGEGALVQCFQCGVKYRHWYKGDVPLSVHQKCNSRCLFLQTLSSKSKPLPPEQRPTRSYIQPDTVGSNTEGEEVSKHSLLFPDYSDHTIRLQSFKHWGGVLPAQELAEGGFYMLARRDIVKCFSCKIILQDWERSDNVIDEHHKYSPNCLFLKETFLSAKRNSEMLSPYSSIEKTNQYALESTVIKSRDSQSSQLPSTSETLSGVDIKLPSLPGQASSSCWLEHCVHCHWYKGDVPLSVHQKCNPRCSFLQSLGSNCKFSPPEQRPTKLYIQPESIGSNPPQDEEVSKHSLQFPDYSDQAIRLQSFKHWSGVLPAQELAEGGFYMIARRDIVKCFSCKIILQDWERSDNVIDEHYKYSPNCLFLKRIKSNNEMLPLSKPGQPCTEKLAVKNHDNQPSLSIWKFEAPSSDTQLPPASMNSRSSSRSSDDGNEETISCNASGHPIQSSSGSDDSSGLFISPKRSPSGSPAATQMLQVSNVPELTAKPAQHLW